MSVNVNNETDSVESTDLFPLVRVVGGIEREIYVRRSVLQDFLLPGGAEYVLSEEGVKTWSFKAADATVNYFHVLLTDENGEARAAFGNVTDEDEEYHATHGRLAVFGKIVSGTKQGFNLGSLETWNMNSPSVDQRPIIFRFRAADENPSAGGLLDVLIRPNTSELVTIIGNLEDGSPVISGINGTGGLRAGDTLTGGPFLSTLTIVSVDSASAITLSETASTDATAAQFTVTPAALADTSNASNFKIPFSINNWGQVTIGKYCGYPQVDPTAYTAGLALGPNIGGKANYAPLKFLASSSVGATALMTVPEAGAMEYAGGKLYFTESDATRRFVVQAAAATKVTAGAPKTNDGYVVLRINGTDLKFMTTA